MLGISGKAKVALHQMLLILTQVRIKHARMISLTILWLKSHLTSGSIENLPPPLSMTVL